MEEYRNALKLSGVLISYPNEEVFYSEELQRFIAQFKNVKIKKAFQSFMEYVNKTSFKELCENYVKQFDFNDETTLYLTYGIFGDKRERGLGFVKLKMEFAKAGFYLKDHELPDYLPLNLEFASFADPVFVKKIYMIHYKGITQLYENLKKKNSAYANLLEISLIGFQGVINKLDVKERNVGTN